ncbi:MAG TPA: flavodoxin domain-containing protein [Clostridia bacterium]
MNTLVVFSSKHGTTRKCAQTIADRIKSDLVDCTSKQINLNNYSRIILCTPIYFGGITGEMKRFFKKHKEELDKRSVVLLTCGLGGAQNAQATVDRFLDKFNLKNKINHEHLGGEIMWDSLNFFERVIMKAVSKEGLVPTLDAQKIDKVINDLLI